MTKECSYANKYNTHKIQYKYNTILNMLNQSFTQSFTQWKIECGKWNLHSNRRERRECCEGERSPIRRKAKGRRFKGMRRVAGKSNGRRFKGMRRVAGKSNGRRFEGRRRVAGSKECEASSGSRMVAGSKECEGSPLSLIGDGWLLTELHRRRFELHRRRLSLIATVGAQRRRWELNRDGGS